VANVKKWDQEFGGIMIKVVVVDDHAVVREGLKRIISENPGMCVTGEAEDGYEALKVIKSEPCDVVLLDVSMPNKNGLDVLKQLHAESPRLPVLVLSMHAEDQYAVRVLRAGAAGYLTKESAPARLVQAIRKVVRGGKYVTQTLAEKLVFDLEANTTKAPHDQSDLFLTCAGGVDRAANAGLVNPDANVASVHKRTTAASL